MRIVAISRILDECDIVEAFVRHTAQYASHHIFIDNGSQDGTLEILEKLKQEGLGIKVFQNKSVSFNEVQFNTFLFRDALASYAADWVLCLDADEFIDDRGVEGGLLQALERLAKTQPQTPCIDVPVTEYRRSTGDDAAEIVVPRRIRRRSDGTSNKKVFISGRLTGKNVEVHGGNHLVSIGPKPVEGIRLPGLTLAHFDARSPYQVAAKWVKGWAKVLAAGPVLRQGGANSHYREPFELVRDTPHHLFRMNDPFMHGQPNLDLADDPIDYRGGPLLYTAPPDDLMRALRMMTGYLEELALRHGLLIHNAPEAKRLVDTWNADLKLVIGDETSPKSV